MATIEHTKSATPPHTPMMAHDVGSIGKIINFLKFGGKLA
jgi:hypothetical protein